MTRSLKLMIHSTLSGGAYDERIDGQGCRTDLFWRLTGILAPLLVVVLVVVQTYIISLVLSWVSLIQRQVWLVSIL